MSEKTFKDIFDEYANSKAVIQARKTAISNRLKELRKKKKYSHEEIAKATNISKISYSGYENAYNNTPIEALVRLAIFYDVSLDYLCCRTDNPKGCYFNEVEHSKPSEAQSGSMEEIIAKIVEDKLREHSKE